MHEIIKIHKYTKIDNTSAPDSTSQFIITTLNWISSMSAGTELNLQNVHWLNSPTHVFSPQCFLSTSSLFVSFPLSGQEQTLAADDFIRYQAIITDEFSMKEGHEPVRGSLTVRPLISNQTITDDHNYKIRVFKVNILKDYLQIIAATFTFLMNTKLRTTVQNCCGNSWQI